jgi:hypothetical protein
MNCNVCGNIGEVWEKREEYVANPELRWKLIECPACLGSSRRIIDPVVIKPTFIMRLKTFFISIYQELRRLCRK